MKNIILGIVFFTAIVCMVYFFVVEGFQAGSGSGLGPVSQAAMCAANQSCRTCLAASGCGWAAEYSDPVKNLQGVPDGTIVACIPSVSGMPFISPNLANFMLIKKGAISTLKNFVTGLSDCNDITCKNQTRCVNCAMYSKCTWQQVTAADGTLVQSCVDTSGATPPDTTHNNITSLVKCPPPQCSDMTDCQECTNTTGCGYCITSAKCLKTSEFGSGSNQCASANMVNIPAMCPCGGITDCANCATRVGCAYCKGIKKCVNLDKYGMTPPSTCDVNDVAATASQCVPQLPKMSESGPPPTANDLNAAQNGGNLGSSKPMVTAPGVARPLGASSIPATVKHDTGDDAPLESYVKMLVNSQLAEQGLPTNEPFQVLEANAIPNASDYMKKVFRGVFH